MRTTINSIRDFKNQMDRVGGMIKQVTPDAAEAARSLARQLATPMDTVNLKDLEPGSYMAVNGEITTKERVEQLIASGYRPSSLHTVSEAFVQDALDALRCDRMAGREPEDYCAPDPHAKRIIY